MGNLTFRYLKRWQRTPRGNKHTKIFISNRYKNPEGIPQYIIGYGFITFLVFVSPIVCVYVCVLLTLLRSKKCFSYDFPFILLRSLSPFLCFSVSHSHTCPTWFSIIDISLLVTRELKNISHSEHYIFFSSIFPQLSISVYISQMYMGIKENLMHSRRSTWIVYSTLNTNFRVSLHFNEA